MPKRYLILLGARTTAGGTVATASALQSLNGVSYALEGDRVDCPACGRQGAIACVPPRLPATSNGKQYALEHDLCVCACSPPPRLVANQDVNCQHVGGADGGEDLQDALSRHAPASADKDDMLPLQLVRMSSEEPFRNRPYILELPDRRIEGTTDADGFTRPLTAAERAALVAWHVERDDYSAA